MFRKSFKPYSSLARAAIAPAAAIAAIAAIGALGILPIGVAHAGTMTLNAPAPASRAIAQGIDIEGYTDRQLATFTFALQQRMNIETGLLLNDDRAGPSRNSPWVLKAYCGELWQVARFAERVHLADLAKVFDLASANCQDRVRGLDRATFRKREQDIVAKGASVFARYGLVTADDFNKAMADMPGRDEAAIQAIGNRMIAQSKSEALDGKDKGIAKGKAKGPR